jgi:hypothetical protein
MDFNKKNSGLRCGKWIFTTILMMIFIFIGSASYAQVDSRNQIRPDREKNFEDPDKKKRKRIKSKRNPRFKGKKAYSNKRQLKRSRRDRAKYVDKSPKGDITGRKITTKRTPRTTVARPQPDPYKNRRIRTGTEADRAKRSVPETRTATKKGERARTGDISGQRRVRQKSVRTKRVSRYPQPNPYVGRKIKTEKSRAKSNKNEIRSIRSVSRRSESRKPKSQSRPISATAAPKVKTKRNVYRNHERRGGERSTDKDIAGKKLRTKNTRSSGQDAGIRQYPSVSPYTGRSRYKEGGRFKNTRVSAAPRSATRPPEASSYRKNNKYASRRNSGSRSFSGAKKAKKVRSLTQPSRKGERTIYGSKYNAGSVRSVSGYSDARSKKGPGTPVTLSGRRKRYKQKNTYQGKDRHFGENSSTKDIAGRRLRTRNYKSYNPSYGAAPTLRNSGGGENPNRYPADGLRTSKRAGWNNGGVPLMKKGRNANSASISGYQGRRRAGGMRGSGKGAEGAYTGRMKARKPLTGGGSITRGWNNGGVPLMKKGRNANSASISGYQGRRRASGMTGYGKGADGVYAGRMKARKPLTGGGSITRGWNNGGVPLMKKGRNANSASISGYQGRRRAGGMTGSGKSAEGVYAGRMKSKKPLKGGGSITRGWNNGGVPLMKKGRNANSASISGYQGRRRASGMTGSGKGVEGVYAGRMKSKKPLKGSGGSITRHWNNKEEPLIGKRQTDSDKGRLAYQGNINAKKPLKGGGGSITRRWNNHGEPIKGKGITGTDKEMASYQGKMKAAGKGNLGPSEGIERGRNKSLSFVGIGNPEHMGLQREANNKKVNNRLPKELTRKERLRLKGADGLDNGRSKAFTFWALGDPSQGGLKKTKSQTKGRLHPGSANTSSYQGKMRAVGKGDLGPSEGIERGRNKSLSFIRLGNPEHMGLQREANNKRVNNRLPKELTRKERHRLKGAEGLDNGRSRAFTFWALGDPSQGGLMRTPSQAKGRLHPSSTYTASHKSRNSIAEKEQPVKLKIWWAKLFKKNSNQPDSVKEKPKRPRYDKGEGSIWETAERENWYNN